MVALGLAVQNSATVCTGQLSTEKPQTPTTSSANPHTAAFCSDWHHTVGPILHLRNRKLWRCYCVDKVHWIDWGLLMRTGQAPGF